MTFEELDTYIKSKADQAPNVGKTLKLALDEGTIFIDMTQEPAVVTNEDKDADTTVKTNVETLDKLRKGDLNPMMAMMGGKVKISGDMGLALKLQGILS